MDVPRFGIERSVIDKELELPHHVLEIGVRYPCCLDVLVHVRGADGDLSHIFLLIEHTVDDLYGIVPAYAEHLSTPRSCLGALQGSLDHGTLPAPAVRWGRCFQNS